MPYDCGAQGAEYTSQVSAAVLVLEDDPLIRRGVVRQIEAAGFTVVAQAGDVVAGRAAIETAGATIGVFDLQLSDGSSIPLIRLAVDRQMAILVLTVWDDDENVYQALAAGASGYLLEGDAARVAESLAVLQDGGAPISPIIARRLLDDFRSRGLNAAAVGAAPAATDSSTASFDPSLQGADLTGREREIIELFAKGATYDDVARMLSMSVNTVRHHVRSMYRKLHVSSKTEAVTIAYRLG
jgi:DNA-binding NarL/FixJ family response regulator